jgi:hypothetical protein
MAFSIRDDDGIDHVTTQQALPPGGGFAAHRILHLNDPP